MTQYTFLFKVLFASRELKQLLLPAFLMVVLCTGTSLAETWEGPYPVGASFIFRPDKTGPASDYKLTVTGMEGASPSGYAYILNLYKVSTPTVENNEITISNGNFVKYFSVMRTQNQAQPDGMMIQNNIFRLYGGQYIGGAFRVIEHASGTCKNDIIANNRAYMRFDSESESKTSNNMLVFSSDGLSTLKNNYVEIEGGKFGLVIGNNSGSGNVLDNELVISDGIFTGVVTPARSYDGTIRGNVVKLTGGVFTRSVAAGVVDPTVMGNGTAIGNTMFLGGSANVSDATLYGGAYGKAQDGNSRLTDTIAPKYFSGNKLVIDHWRGTAKNIYNFETIDVYTANDVTNGTTVLELTDAAGTNLGDTQGTGTRVNLAGVDAGAKLNIGDRIHLLKNVAGISGVMTNDQEVKQGISVVYNGVMEKTDDSVDFHITGVRPSEESTTVPESNQMNMGLLEGGSELLSDALLGGMVALQTDQQPQPHQNALEAVAGTNGLTRGNIAWLDKEHLLGRHLFGVMSGGRLRYKTDTSSSFSMASANLITGANYVWGVQQNSLFQTGAFVEAGWGDVSSSTAFSGGSLQGEGDVHYYGGGLLARYDLGEGALRGLYLDASARMGKMYNRRHSSDLRSPTTGAVASYEFSPTYYALHGGIGYAFPVAENWLMDVSGRYFWTRVEGGNVTVLGDEFHLDAATSSRVRAGVKLDYTGNKRFTPYVKLACDHEFDGKSSGQVYGLPMRSSSLKGTTGIVEVGFSAVPKWNDSLNVEASVSGYGGKREGVMGTVRLTYSF